MGHDPWVTWVVGHELNGSHGSWVTAVDPFAALLPTGQTNV